MYRKANPLFLICQTPMHAGSGSELGIVDLPIQRERHTSFPKIESSSLKGAIREAFERSGANELTIHKAFGFDKDSASEEVRGAIPEREREYSGALGFTDARLLLFPVKSMKGIFAWITCPKVLKQFAEDMRLAERRVDGLDRIIRLSLEQNKCTTTRHNDLIVKGSKGENVILEEYTFKVSSKSDDLAIFGEWLSRNILSYGHETWADKLKTDIIILPNDDFKDFVNLSTEVITRTKIDNATGTVASGALFTEEYLPAESIMYSLVLTASEFKAQDRLEEDTIRSFFAENLPSVCQIGGNATLGKGIVSTKFLNQ